MLTEGLDNNKDTYKCSRCGGFFPTYGDHIVRCPFCSMICDEVKCRIVEMGHEEY